MKKIYLHIGTHKTGTTSIQQFLYANEEALKKNNFDYLNGNCVWGGHHPLGWAFQGATLAIKEYCDWYDYGVINRLEDEIKGSDYGNFFISSENLYFNKDKEFIVRFFERFKNYDIYIIVYLREQVSFIESWYTELVRADYFKLSEDIDSFIKDPKYNLDYYDEVIKWADYVGKDNLFVFDFKLESKNGKLLERLCEHLGVDFSCFDKIKDANERVSKVQLEKLLQLNVEENNHNQWLIERRSILDKDRNKDSYTLLNKKQRQLINNRYKQSNLMLKEEFGVDLQS